ncbi:sigma-54 interaction domain-containing protein [Salinimonas lutimaris]|uniref:sigma-54 interaction domain-containing protein n=1 Tax=Salinimonas lutimaris TaxID=914153 RepID=UPI001C30D401|nr:sigma-54 dependent transcriptional regulator [Salinimonas lutimaris]
MLTDWSEVWKRVAQQASVEEVVQHLQAVTGGVFSIGVAWLNEQQISVMVAPGKDTPDELECEQLQYSELPMIWLSSCSAYRLTEVPRPAWLLLGYGRTEISQELLAMFMDIIGTLLHNLHQQLSQQEAIRQVSFRQTDLLLRMGKTASADTIIGAGLDDVLLRAAKVAATDTTVLLQGETGSGKELIARAIHDGSVRAGQPFVRVNCGAIAPDLIDAELFGHEKGSFTGATSQRKGWFERAHQGTLFLDEVGELTLAAQVRLLRVLQDKTITRVGGEKELHCDVRIVAATHQDLAARVQQGAFREDLWYRLNTFCLLIPALRQRTADIGALARHFCERASIKLGIAQPVLTTAHIRLLNRYHWPGNVRELQSVIERAAILGSPGSLALEQAMGAAQTQPAAAPAEVSSPLTLDGAIHQTIEAALIKTNWRIEGPRGAAALLDVNPSTLRSKMRKLGIPGAPVS